MKSAYALAKKPMAGASFPKDEMGGKPSYSV
jgi:hypothetical protein